MMMILSLMQETRESGEEKRQDKCSVRDFVFGRRERSYHGNELTDVLVGCGADGIEMKRKIDTDGNS